MKELQAHELVSSLISMVPPGMVPFLIDYIRELAYRQVRDSKNGLQI